MNRLSLSYLLAAGLGLGCYQPPAEAMSISFQPVSQTVNVGDTFAVEVVVSGLLAANQIVSAFDLDVTYDPSILDATGVMFGPFLGDPGPSMFEADNGAVLTSGRIDFWELSYLFDQELASIQSGMDSLSLATLSFQALDVGATSLVFDPAALPGIDVKGYDATPLDLDVSAGSVTVAASSSSSIPEPSTLWLCLLGLGVIARRYIRI